MRKKNRDCFRRIGIRLVIIIILFMVSVKYFQYQKHEGENADEGNKTKICKLLRIPEVSTEEIDRIRVLIKGSDFIGNHHKEILLTADSGFSVFKERKGIRSEECYGAFEEILIHTDMECDDYEKIIIVPENDSGRIVLKNVRRNQDTLAYRGSMEIFPEPEGLILINEVSLEEYLYGVVPSEMPSSFPFEALCAQAICARTYAYSHILEGAYPEYGAHVDDSTAFQVYNNQQENETTNAAVDVTCGQILLLKSGEPASTYFYSTSCGMGTDPAIWDNGKAGAFSTVKGRRINPLNAQMVDEEDFANYIEDGCCEDYEYDEPWYRWSYSVEEVDEEVLYERLLERYRSNENLVLTWNGTEFVPAKPDKIDEIKDICITYRGTGCVAEELIIETKNQRIKVKSEYNIRYVLCDAKTKAIRNDRKEVLCSTLLPSAFFILETGKKEGNVIGYCLKGGGYGHGVGMSQNAAAHMAKDGFTASEILHFFYGNQCELKTIYG